MTGMAGGLLPKPRSKELSRLSSEPGMKGGHPQGASWGREEEGNQGVPREGRGLGQLKAEHPSTEVWGARHTHMRKGHPKDGE